MKKFNLKEVMAAGGRCRTSSGLTSSRCQMKDKVFFIRAYGFFLIIVLIAASAWVITH